MPGREPTLSALVVACNEEQQLADCLDTLKFADEIVVVLDKCTDATQEVAQAAGARTLAGNWEIEGPRRMAGIDACRGDWILEVDADERVSKDLAAEVRSAVREDADAFYLIPFENFIGDRLVRYGWGGSWGVSARAGLFRKGNKTWGNQRIHPAVTLKGERRWLKACMIHHVDRDVSDMIQRLDRYTAARAADMRSSGSTESFGRNFRRLFTRFFKCYVRRKGYKEGYHGFLIAFFAAIWPMLAWLKFRLDRD